MLLWGFVVTKNCVVQVSGWKVELTLQSYHKQQFNSTQTTLLNSTLIQTLLLFVIPSLMLDKVVKNVSKFLTPFGINVFLLQIKSIKQEKNCQTFDTFLTPFWFHVFSDSDLTRSSTHLKKWFLCFWYLIAKIFRPPVIFLTSLYIKVDDFKRYQIS